MEYKFEEDDEWSHRGYVEVQRDADGNIVGIEVENVREATISEEKLDKKC